MPKFPKGFGRRKSTANAIEDVQNTPTVEHSFKVFERPDGGSKSFDGGLKLSKASTNGFPIGRPRTSHREENMFEGIIHGNRGSGASNTNTASTTDNSSRLSAASTAPSSTDTSRGEDPRTPHEKPFGDIPVPPIPKSQSPFSLKAAGRSMSWSRNSNKTFTPPPPSKELPSTPANDEYQPRSRAVTASSYASTATPPKLDERDLGLSLGGDFAEMFAGFGKRQSVVMEPVDNRAMSQSPDVLPAGPASRTNPSARLNQPSPLNIDKSKNVEVSPYSWSSQHSNDGLILNTSPPPFVSQTAQRGPPVPQHGPPSRTNNTSPNMSRQQRPGETGLRRNSGYTGRRQSTIEYGDTVDEDARLMRESINAGRRLNDPSYSPKVRDSWALPSDKAYKVDDGVVAGWTRGSVETTPRAKPVQSRLHEDSMFDDHIAEAAHLASRFEETSVSPSTLQNPKNKVMTPAQFERYKQDQERMRSLGGKSQDDEDEEDETYDDEEDEAEKNRQLAKQRRKQEAHMAVYRQQMMKVTGETSTPTGGSARPPVFGSQSSPNLNLGQPEDGEEEDEEVPLAILQAHGFPNKNKPPMRSAGSNPNLRAPSAMSGALPVFARNLPQDPYFGASIVHPSNRESLAFGTGAGSVNGSTPRGLPVGGLVGVIATEERSRAMRRGSPNAQGEYGPPPPSGFNNMGMPLNGSPGLMNGMGGMSQMGPMGPMGPINPMMLSPGDQAQMQMSQQMQQFMQMQVQFMQMMTQGQGPPGMNGNAPPQFGQIQRPHSAQGPPQLRPGSSHQRTMSSLDPNSAPWMQQGGMFTPSIHIGGYTPSIAPSERSNVGLPGRYRPVSQIPLADNKSRISTMSGALQGWESKNGQATIKAVKKSTSVSDEDDEEGWEEMAKKRATKKSLWRTKKDTNGLKEVLGYTQ